MTLDYEIVDNVDPDEWQEVADNCDYATFFHTPAWYVAFNKISPSLRIATKLFSFASGKKAILPLMEQKMSVGLHGRYLLGPAGCYGGWISSDLLDSRHALAIWGWLKDSPHSVFWRLNPYDDLSSTLDPFVTQTDTAEVLSFVDLEDENQLRERYKRSVRKEINKARKGNITIRQAESWDHWIHYFELYQASLRRWGDKATSNYPIQLFRYFYECDRRHIKLWTAFDSEKIVGGNLNFYQSNHCVEWHASFDSDYFGLGVRNFLVDSIVVDAMRQGYRFYDFNPSGGHEGTRKFKQSFGTIQKSTNLITVDKSPYALKKLRQLAESFR